MGRVSGAPGELVGCSVQRENPSNTDHGSGQREESSVFPAGSREQDVDVSVVMPCLNEERSLPHCLSQAKRLLQILADRGISGEIVLSDNGSTDKSVEIALSAGVQVVHCPARGYGHALRWGVQGSRGRFVVMGDADGSYDFLEAIPMIDRLSEGYELCMGSRFRGEIRRGAMPWKNQHIGNPLLTGLLNLFFRSGLSDAHSGLRAFTREAFDRINPTSPGMEFASEIVVKAALLGLRRTEVPVTLHPDMRDRPPHLRPWHDGWRHLRFLVMLSPAWLYFVPAVLFSVAGLAILGVLLATPPGDVAHFGRFWIGEHWAIVGTALVLGGHQTALLGLASVLVGVRDRYRRVTPLLLWAFRIAHLDRLLLAGSGLVVAGIGVLLFVVRTWVQQSFAGLQMTREAICGTTLIMLGMQTIFGGFLLSIIAGNDADLELAVRRLLRERSRQILPILPSLPPAKASIFPR